MRMERKDAYEDGGDSIRFGVNTAVEDETDLSKVSLENSQKFNNKDDISSDFFLKM